jgi:hypothetical protein
MAFRFVLRLFLDAHLFLRMSHVLFPLAFELLASLRARPITPIARALPFTNILHFCLPLGAAPLHDIVDGR